VIGELGVRLTVSVEAESLPPLDREKTLVYCIGDRDRRPGMADWPVAGSDVTDDAAADFHRRAVGRRMKIDHASIGMNDPMCGAQGIDHALNGDSSQGAREEHHVGALRRQ